MEEILAQDPYQELRLLLREKVREIVRQGEYDHIKPTPHKKRQIAFSEDSRFRFNIFPSPEFVSGNGRNFNFSPLEVVMGIYGEFKNPMNISRGFVCNSEKYHRVGIGLNLVMDAEELMKEVFEGFEKIKRGTYCALADGNYQQFASLVVPVVNESIGRFKRKNAHKLPYVFTGDAQ